MVTFIRPQVICVSEVVLFVSVHAARRHFLEALLVLDTVGAAEHDLLSEEPLEIYTGAFWCLLLKPLLLSTFFIIARSSTDDGLNIDTFN